MELEQESASAVMGPESETHSTPYESKIIVLSVGSKIGNPVIFSVHKEKLVHIPFFQAALREDAFVEGQQGKVDFEEEDPVLFRRVVEFIYEGDFFPRRKVQPDEIVRFEVPLEIQSTSLVGIQLEKIYTDSDPTEVGSGIFVSTARTHRLFTMITKLLCVAERYMMEDLLQTSFEKLKLFPIGANEVLVLIQELLGSIPESRTDIHKFVENQVRLHLPRLSKCPKYISFLESEMTVPGQVLTKMITKASLSATENDFKGILEDYHKVVICIADVTREGSIEKYGSDDGYAVKFATAKAGDVLSCDGEVSPRNIIRARHSAGGPVGAYPAESFKLLQVVRASFTPSRV